MQPKIYSPKEHQIDSTLVDSNALYVIRKLQDAGYKAYLVGGGVRDLLVNKSPKDFDISTSAKPEEIKQIFHRKCLLIGRRFRLAHIRFGRKVIEVATFRAGVNESELIVQDNIWGTEENDVMRRDFTINGLFYNPSDETVIDYIGGLDDIHEGILKTIGDPVVRFKQDPVRMIRLLKFRARFGFKIDALSKKALIQCREEIKKSSPARILEEMLRMLESGASAPFIQLLEESWMLELLLPELTHYLKGEKGKQIYRYLSAADQLNRQATKYPLHRATLIACLLFPMLEQNIDETFISQDKKPNLGDVMMLTNALLKKVVTSSFSHFPRRLIVAANFILTTQYRFTPFTKRRYIRGNLFDTKEFSLALDFFKIRATINPALRDAYLDLHKHYKEYRQQREHRKPHHPPPSRRRRKKRG